jgi:hypothetical protein
MHLPIQELSMAYGNRLAQHTVLMALVFGLVSSVAHGEQEPAQESSTQQSLLMNESPLTNFEKMELHQRRYTSAANNVAQLFKQLNQKAQEVVLAARTAEAKDNSQNRRQLELKMRLLDNASSTYAIQYSQLQAQMQNEYRNYMALSNDLKERYAMAKEVKGETREAPDVKPKTGKPKDQKKESKDQKESKAKEARATGEGRTLKAKEGRTAETARVAISPAKDPRVMDLDTAQVRARRDGLKEPGGAPAATSGPTLNIVQ